jgi:hypothetical protein
MKAYPSIMLIAAIAGIIMVGALAVTTTTVQARVGNDKDFHNQGHNACENAGPAKHNPHCQGS